MLAIITDSTCDLQEDELRDLNVERVPLYVNFQNEVYKDWVEISPKQIIEGVQAGADVPSTSQPSPQDFETAYQNAVQAGASEILCLTISSTLSGTYQSATLAKEAANVPVMVFDSRAASLGLGELVRKAASMRSEGRDLEGIVKTLEHMRDANFVRFTVASLDFLQKNGRIGRAGALLGSLLNIKPILGLEEGTVEAVGRARGAKKALNEMLEQIKAYAQNHPGRMVANFIHVMDDSAVEPLKQAMRDAGLDFRDAGTHKIGAVIACHVGPGTYGVYITTEPEA